MKNTHGGVLLLVKLQTEACNFTKSNTSPFVFSRFLNCTNDTKSRNASQILVDTSVYYFLPEDKWIESRNPCFLIDLPIYGK